MVDVIGRESDGGSARITPASDGESLFAATTAVRAPPTVGQVIDKEVSMFFPTLIAAPILAGLVAGVWTGRRSVPWGLAGVCVALGMAGAIVSAFNPDGRSDNITFSLVASVVCAGLVWLGYSLGRLTRRSTSHA